MVVSGIIRPPPDIRVVADLTASHVAKKGRVFEERVMRSAKVKTPKFAFLQPTSPYHPYYLQQIQFFENGGELKKDDDDDDDQKQATKKKEKPLKNESARKQESKQKASVIDPIAKTLLTQRAKLRRKPESKDTPSPSTEAEIPDPNKPAEREMPLVPPPALEFANIVAPANLDPAHLETIQLVAQFSAMDGKGGPFLHQLTIREWGNPEFSFCQPRHAHFAYFSALVDAYRTILSDWTSSASTAIVPVDEDPTTAAMKVLEEAAYRAEYELEMETNKDQQEEGEIVAIDWYDFVVVETIDFAHDEAIEMAMLPPPPPQQQPLQQKTAIKADKDAMDESDDEGETIRVVPSYTPKVVATTDVKETRAIDPITGKSVSVADMPEHMRIQLLDPKWAEERKKFQQKQKDSNLVAGDAVVANLSRFSQSRGDLFGKSEQELLNKEHDSKRRLAEANEVLRQQATQQNVGPSLPLSSQGSEPAPKRMRMELPPVGSSLPPPPPPPPPMQQQHAQYPSQGQAPLPAVGAVDQSQDPMSSTTSPNTSKAQKELLSEAEFASSLSKPEVTLQIRIPNDPTQMAWNFFGQILSLTVDVMSTVKQVKEQLSSQHLNAIPVNKMQFKDPEIGFLSNNNKTLASLNVGPTATLDLIPKTRGGRR